MLDDASVMRAAASMLTPRQGWPALLRELIEGLAGENGPLRFDGEQIGARAE
jgi:hypothetical protein